MYCTVARLYLQLPAKEIEKQSDSARIFDPLGSRTAFAWAKELQQSVFLTAGNF
jgi:hypothetical protein